MFEKYTEVRSWLETFIPLVYGKEELGLARIEYLLRLLGNPEKNFRSIHVAGTSGKGSTAFYISKMLQLSVLGSQLSDESQSVSQLSDKPKTGRPKSDSALQNLSNRKQKTDNWKIGLHISPHLVDIRERMQVFQLPISELIFDKSKSTNSKEESLFPRQARKLQITQGFDPVSKNLHETGSSLMPMGRFLKLFEQVRPVVEKMQKTKPELTPSYFEILVAASFKYFAEEKVDWAVVEVGLGGRLDATNVLMPEVSVITNIGLDHTEILGDSIEKIAFEKAGIIKPGVPVVTGATGEALGVIENVAKGKGAKVVLVSASKYLVTGRGKKQKNAQDLNLELAVKVVEVVLSLRGAKRRGNLETRDSFASLRMTEEEVKGFGLGLPGRFEEVEPGVILDGAHNPDKIRSLIEFVRKFPFFRHSRVNESPDPRFLASLRGRSGREDDSKVDEIVLVLAFKKGKNWQQMVDLLIKNLPVKKIIVTEFQAVTDTGRFGTVRAEEIAEYLKVNCQLSIVNCIINSQEAVFEALNTYVIASTSNELSVNSAKQSKKEIATDSSNPRNDRSLVLVTGSLYLVGEVRTMWELPVF